MAVVMMMEWEGFTLDQYDQTAKVLDRESDWPLGMMYHVAASDGSKIRITDVWDSAEHFQQFVEQRLMPAVKQIGAQGEPKVEIYPAHAILTPG